MTLDLTPDQLLSTTRTVRKRLDLSRPVERELLEECFDLAFQAPTGGNQQGWHFVVVTDADHKKALAELYRKSQSETEPPSAPAGQEAVAGDVLGVFEESDRHVGVVECTVDVAAVGVDLFWGSADFMQVGVGALFESQGVDEFCLTC